MSVRQYTEADWTLFRSKINDWIAVYIGKLNKEYLEILSKDEKDSDKFWELYKRIRKDKRQLDFPFRMSRSNLIVNVMHLIHSGIIKHDDLEDFSEPFRKTIMHLSDAWND